MNIRRKRLELQHVISIRVTGTLQHCFKEIEGVKKELLERNLYSTSPILYKVLEDGKDDLKIEILLQMNRELREGADDVFFYQDHVVFPECLFTRYITDEHTASQVRQELQMEAEKENILTEEPYYVIIPIPGGTVTDVYAPIKGEKV